MSENIDIIITDQIASTVSEKISAIAEASDVAFTNVEKLKSALNSIGVNKVNELKDAVDKLSTSHKDANSALDLYTDSWLNHIKTVAGGIIVYQGIREAMRLVIGFFAEGVKAVNEYQISVIQLAAIYTTLAVDKVNIAGNYIEAKRYAEALMPTLMEIDKATTLNLGNLIKITEEFAKQGIALNATNKDQVEGFTRIANAVALYSRNGADARQVQQEIRAMIQGQSRDSDQLGKLLKSILGDSLKPTLENWREQGKAMGDSGFIIQKIGELLKGFGPATKDMAGTWGAVSSSMKTTFDIVARETFTPILKDWSSNLDKLNVYLRDNKTEIADTIQNAWNKLKTAIDDNKDSVIKFAKEAWETTKQLAEIGSTMLGIVNKISSVPEIVQFGLVGYFLFGKTGMVVGAVAGMVDGILSNVKNKIQEWAYDNGIQVNQWNQQRIQQDRDKKIVPNAPPPELQNDPGLQAFLDRNAATNFLTPSQQASTAWADETSKAMQGLTAESGKLGFALEYQQEIDKKAIKLAEQQAAARDKLSESTSKIIDKENEATKTWGTFRVAFNTLNDALNGTEKTGYKASISLETYNNGINATQERIKDMIDKPFDAITNAMKKVDDPFAKFTEALAKIESTGKDYLAEIIKDTEEVKNQTQQGKLSKEQEKIALQTLKLEAAEVSKKMKESSSATIDAMQRELAVKDIYITVTKSNAELIRAEVQKMTENQKLYTQSMSIAGEAAGLTTGFITDMGKAFVEFNKQGPIAKDTMLGLSYVMFALGNQLGGKNGKALQDIGKGLTALNSQQDTSGLSGAALDAANQANIFKQISGYGAIANGIGQMVGGSIGKGISTTANYATTGAIIGSVIPGIGTVAGAIVGGVGGLISSIFGGSGRDTTNLDNTNQANRQAIEQMASAGNETAMKIFAAAGYSDTSLKNLRTDSAGVSAINLPNTLTGGSQTSLFDNDWTGAKGTALVNYINNLGLIDTALKSMSSPTIVTTLDQIKYKWDVVIASIGDSTDLQKAKLNDQITAITGITADSIGTMLDGVITATPTGSAGEAFAQKLEDSIASAVRQMAEAQFVQSAIMPIISPVIGSLVSQLIVDPSSNSVPQLIANVNNTISSLTPVINAFQTALSGIGIAGNSAATATSTAATATSTAATATTTAADQTSNFANTLTSSLDTAFKNSLTAAEQFRTDFTATINDTLTKAVTTAFSSSVITPALQPWIDSVTAAFASGPVSATELQNFANSGRAIVDSLAPQVQSISDILTGAGLISSSNSNSSSTSTSTSTALTSAELTQQQQQQVADQVAQATSSYSDQITSLEQQLADAKTTTATAAALATTSDDIQKAVSTLLSYSNSMWLNQDTTSLTGRGLLASQQAYVQELFKGANSDDQSIKLNSLQNLQSAITDSLSTARKLATDPLEYARMVAQNSQMLRNISSDDQQKDATNSDIRNAIVDLTDQVKKGNLNNDDVLYAIRDFQSNGILTRTS